MMHIPRMLAMGGVLVATSGLFACSGAPAEPDAPTSLTIAVPDFQFSPNFDPQNGSFLWFMATQPVYEALIHWDVEAKAWAPWLAEEFEISEDGLTMSVTLRDDVDFVDETHMDAEGVAKALNATFQSPTAYFHYLDAYYGPQATVTGEYTFDLTTTAPMFEESSLLMELSVLPIASPRAIDDPSLVASEPVGSGPYLLQEVIPEVSATYVRNPDYWNPDAFDFDEIVVQVISDKVAALNALKSGQADAAELDGSFAAEAEESGLTVNTGPAAVNFIPIADRTGEFVPALGDVRVRRALNLAIDREAIVEQLEFGYGNPSSQPFDENRDEYVVGGDDRYAYDPDRARQLMAEAGFEEGFTLRFAYFAARNAIDYKPAITQYLSEIGVTVEWVDPKADLATLIDSGQVQGFLVDAYFSHSIKAYTGEGFGALWSQQPITDPEFTALLARYSGSLSEHDDVTPALAEYILDQAFYLQISQPQAVWVTAPGVRVTIANMPSFFPVLMRFEHAE